MASALAGGFFTASATWEAQNKPGGDSKNWSMSTLLQKLLRTHCIAFVGECGPAGTSHKRHGFDLWGQEDPLEEGTQPTPVFLPGESHG